MARESEGLQSYLDSVGECRTLTREEEVEIFKRLESGDESAREEIVECNLRFVIKIARQFMGRGLALEDLIQEGSIGLMEVVSKFDYKRGFRFSTYAAFWIRQAIQQALRKHSNLIRLPVRKSRMLGKINEHIARFNGENGRDPTISEMAEELDVPETNMAAMMEMRESVLSLDEVMEGGGSLLDSVSGKLGSSPFESALGNERQDKVQGVLRHLSEKERRVVCYRFGFTDGEALSLRNTSRHVGLSQEGVRRVESKALGKLRRPAIAAKVANLI